MRSATLSFLPLLLLLALVACSKKSDDAAPAAEAEAPAISAVDSGAALDASKEAWTGQWTVAPPDEETLQQLPEEERELLRALDGVVRAAMVNHPDGTTEMYASVAGSERAVQNGTWEITDIELDSFTLLLTMEASDAEYITVEPRADGSLLLSAEASRMVLNKTDDLDAFFAAPGHDTPQEAGEEAPAPTAD